MHRNQRHHLGQSQIRFETIPLNGGSELLQHVKGPLEMANGLVVGGSGRTALAGPPPRLDGEFGQSGLSVVPGQQLGLALHEGREAVLQHLGDAPVRELAPALEQRLVGCIPQERVLERVARRRWGSLAEDQFGGHQLIESVAQLSLGDWGHGGQEVVC